MGRTMRSLLRSLLILACSLFVLTPLFAQPASQAELDSILQKIEARHYRWIAIRADVLLFFATSENSKAMCGGELLYQRLDERMFLTCVDSQRNLSFVFRTLDRRFDLYLPDRNTIYHGSIFDMENSPDIESHLKPRDLYRALKPMAVDPRHAEIERTNAVITNLDVYGKKGLEEYLARKLYLTPEGDVKGELFFNPQGRTVTEIHRFDFQEIPAKVGTFRSIIFPKKITIVSPETKKGSAVFFAKVKALDFVDPLEFLLRVPAGTQEVFLDEKDPKLILRQLEWDKKFNNSNSVGPIAVQKEPENAPPKLQKTSPVDADADADLVVETSSPETVPEPALETSPSPTQKPVDGNSEETQETEIPQKKLP